MLFKFLSTYQKYDHADVAIDGRSYRMLVADTFTKQAIGLSYRNSIPRDGGMLFVFGRESRADIVMRGMRFPLDVIWLDKDQRIVKMLQNVPPASSAFDYKTYGSGVVAKYWMEFNSGFIKRKRISTKSKVRIKN